MRWIDHFKTWLHDIARLPWRDAALTLRERFREDRLGLTASSLTFTTTMALIPLVTVALAVLTAFPMFYKFQDILQKWLVESLVPDNISRQVLGFITQFAGKANRLGAAGLVALFVTALALIFTIDRTLNSIWRVRTHRTLTQRLLVYWSALTLGPLLLAGSLTLTSYALSASKGAVEALPGGVGFLLDALQYLLVAAGMAAMFRYVPNTYVRWGHAWMGGFFVSTCLELAKKLLALYLGKVSTYSAMYGTFATVPILLVWIYVAWVIVLLGAALTAYVPSLLAGVPRRRIGAGWRFQLGLELLQALDQAAQSPSKGRTMTELCAHLQTSAQILEPVLEALVGIDWIGQLSDPDAQAGGRYVLLVNPQTTTLTPLMQTLLLLPSSATEKVWQSRDWANTPLREVI